MLGDISAISNSNFSSRLETATPLLDTFVDSVGKMFDGLVQTRELLSYMRVVDDIAQRGIALMEECSTYSETLKKLRRAIQNRRRGMLSKGVSILHDNARPYVARTTVDLLQQSGWDIITHPPYSPDLAPNDYHLFPKLKENLVGMRFNDDDEVKDEVLRFLNDMAASWYDMGIQKLLQRLQKCIDRNGDYVEK
ncbi:Histone-lysine N-methyltransferase SETMAR [Anthophora quadrimaculata]